MAGIKRLPKAVAEEWDWQLYGLCRGMDSAEFFHPDGERGLERKARITRAKAVCRRCPVIAECRTHALSVQEKYGVWGGLSEHERDVILQALKHR